MITQITDTKLVSQGCIFEEIEENSDILNLKEYKQYFAEKTDHIHHSHLLPL